MCMIPKACKVLFLYAGVAMEKIVRQSLLFDFYGELLTEHQKEIYEDCVMNDMSYTEVAGLYGISRQGVYDMIRRCDKILEGYEEKLMLVDRFERAKEKTEQIKETVSRLAPLMKTKQSEELIGILNRQTTELMDEF